MGCDLSYSEYLQRWRISGLLFKYFVIFMEKTLCVFSQDFSSCRFCLLPLLLPLQTLNGSSISSSLYLPLHIWRLQWTFPITRLLSRLNKPSSLSTSSHTTGASSRGPLWDPLQFFPCHVPLHHGVQNQTQQSKCDSYFGFAIGT